MMTEQNMTLVLLIIAAISYLLGSVNFSILFSRKANKDDIRNHGSGNAGATNMYRTHGSMAGMITVVCDILKVLAAILIARLLLGEAIFASYPFLIKYYAGLFCVIGHIFPVFFKFKGGKGVATCAGMILLLDIRIWLILFAVFCVTIAVSKMVSLGSVIMAVLYPFLTYLFYVDVEPVVSSSLDFIQPYERWVLTGFATVFSVIVIFKHRENIRRIFNGTESKVSRTRKSEE